MQARYRKLREDAYAQGLVEYDALIKLPTFRDFVVLYVAEGYERNRNRVSIANSDASIVAMAAGWLGSCRPRARRTRFSTTRTRISESFADSGPRCGSTKPISVSNASRTAAA
jgi:hypothetical protein